MKSILYIHDFSFKFNKLDLYTAVGMPEEYFNRFLDSGFNKVYLCTRLNHYALNDNSGFEKINNKNIEHIFKTPIQYTSLIKFQNLRKIAKTIIETDLLVINYPTLISIPILLLKYLLRPSLPYVCEVAADNDQFNTKKLGNIITFFFKLISKSIIKNASGAIYVNNFLKNKYANKNSIVASNVNIEKVIKRDYEHLHGEMKETLILSFAGGLNERKGLDTILKTIKLLVDLKEFKKLELHIMGGHSDRNWIQIAKSYGVNDYVKFHGILNKHEMESIFKLSHIYLQPSLTEGLPRSTIEAMSFGLPVIATNIPAFRDLIATHFLVPQKDHIAIKNIIIEMRLNKDKYIENCNKNEETASRFLYSELQNKRVEFYSQYTKI